MQGKAKYDVTLGRSSEYDLYTHKAYELDIFIITDSCGEASTTIALILTGWLLDTIYIHKAAE